MLLVDLPTELLLGLFSHLHIQHIHTLQLSGRAFTNFIRSNENKIYQAAAIIHGFVLHGTISLEEATRYAGWLNGVSTWKMLCKIYFMLEARWQGQLLPSSGFGLTIARSAKAGMNICSFKIDEEEDTVISSRTVGGIRVVSIGTRTMKEKLLWELKAPYVAAQSRIEWSNGFLAFSAPGNCIEIWRRSIDAWDPQSYMPCNPLPKQLAAVTLHAPTSVSIAKNSNSNPGQKGVYVPFSHLQAPAEGQVFRLVYPDLVLASATTQKAFIWDIPSSRLVETVDIPPPSPITSSFTWGDPTIYSVDITKHHVFVCWDNAMIVYPRHQNGEVNKQASFSITNPGGTRPQELLGAHVGNFPLFGWSKRWDFPQYPPAHLPYQTLLSSRRLSRKRKNSSLPCGYIGGKFQTVHVSPDGKDLVAITTCPCWVVYVKDFEKRPESGYGTDQSFRLHLCSEEAICSTFDGWRIVVGVGCEPDEMDVSNMMAKTIFSITINDRRRPQQLNASGSLCPTVIAFESFFGNLRSLTSVQLTDNRVWLTLPNTGMVHIGDPSEYHPDSLCITYVELSKSEMLYFWDTDDD